jgi:16S rRNA (adenine1518-N6/adenine1519-N6)-dimethyltransferase
MITLGQMRELLERRGIQLTKSLGQNFLHDQNQLRRIMAAAEVRPSDRILEIGPGLGPLTELLVQETAHVLAIEKDARLIPILRERFADATNLELLHADALDITRDHLRDWSDWKLVANLPYSVASPILVELAQNPRRPQMLVATLQLEVARRLMARPGEDDYGLLTLLVQLRYEARTLFKIPRGCFFPEPDVDSACIVLVRRASGLLPEDRHATFEKIARRALSQRRKMMAKLLRDDWPDDRIRRALANLQLRPDIRGEKLSVEQFIALANQLFEPS